MLRRPRHHPGHLAIQVGSLVSGRNSRVDRRPARTRLGRRFQVAHQDERAHLLSRDRQLALAVGAVRGLGVDAL